MNERKHDLQTVRSVKAKINSTRNALGLNHRQLYERVSEFYSIRPSTLRTLANPTSDVYPTTVMVDALAQALGVPRDTLATDDEYSLLLTPYRTAQRIADPSESNHTQHSIPNARTAAQRLQSFMQQRGYSVPGFARALNAEGYRIGKDRIYAIYRDRPNYVTLELLIAAAEVFSRRQGRVFPVDRLLKCDGNCPHCHPWLITA